MNTNVTKNVEDIDHQNGEKLLLKAILQTIQPGCKQSQQVTGVFCFVLSCFVLFCFIYSLIQQKHTQSQRQGPL